MQNILTILQNNNRIKKTLKLCVKKSFFVGLYLYLTLLKFCEFERNMFTV